MSENIERLREAMIEADGQIESACAAYERGLGSGGSELIGALNERRSALAAVEQEMAELRKRPTLEEVDAVIERVGYAVDDAMNAVQASLRSVEALYARAEATP